MQLGKLRFNRESAMTKVMALRRQRKGKKGNSFYLCKSVISSTTSKSSFKKISGDRLTK